MTNTYRPLPSYLTIGKSPIEGLGLFTNEYIEEGTLIGITHHWPKEGYDDWIRTPLGGFYNHSDNPNAHVLTKMLDNGNECRELYSSRDILAGEEIMVKYTLYSVEI